MGGDLRQEFGVAQSLRRREHDLRTGQRQFPFGDDNVVGTDGTIELNRCDALLPQ